MPSPFDDGDDEDDDQDDEELQAAPTTAELLRGEGVPERSTAQRLFHVGVLPENMRAVQVFRRCKPTIVVGLGGGAWLGISALELASRLDLDGIPESERTDIAARVDVMDRVSTRIRNEPKKKPAESAPPTPSPPPRQNKR